MMFVLLLTLAGLNIDLPELELFKGCQVAKGLGGFILFDAERLVLVDTQGELVTIYNEPGEGPYDIRGPRVLFADDDELIILTNGKNIISFNKQLQPKPGYPPIPKNLHYRTWNGSLKKKEGSVTLRISSAWYTEEPILTTFKLVEGQWEIIHTVERSPGDEAEWMFTQGTWVGGTCALRESGPYVLEWLDDDLSPNMTISNNVEAIAPEGQPYIGAVYPVAEHKGRYLVPVGFMDKEKPALLDIFGADGAHLRRLNLGSDLIVPSENSEEVFVLVNDLDRLITFEAWSKEHLPSGLNNP